MNLREILNSLLRQNLINVVVEDVRRLDGLTGRGHEVLEYFNKAQILLAMSSERRRSSTWIFTSLFIYKTTLILLPVLLSNAFL